MDATHQELRRMPTRYFSAPAHIHVVGYLSDSSVADASRARFTALAMGLGIDEADIHWQENRAFASKTTETDSLLLKLETGPEHYTIQTWRKSAENPDFGRLKALPAGTDFQGPEKLTELDIVWLSEPVAEADLRAFFDPENEVLSSIVIGGKLQIATDYEPDKEGRERYLLMSLVGDLLPGQAELVVDNIVKIENHFHLLYRPKIRFEEAARKLADIEAASTAALIELNESLPVATTATLKQALHQAGDGFAQLATLSSRFQRHFSDAVVYKDILKSAFRAWREQPAPNFLPLSAPVLRSSTLISGEYGQLLARIERIRKQKADLISILRTKVQLLEGDQSMALQQSMHETTKSQMAMQMTIEGLYVFIVAFYLTELARIVFEALEERGVIHVSPNLLAAGFIPIAIGAGLILSGKARHWLKRRRSE